MNLSQILKEAVNKEASDVHLKVGSPPVLRIGKELVNLPFEPLTTADVERFIAEVLGNTKNKNLKDQKEMDLAFFSEGIGRFRVDIFYQRNLPGMVMRRVKTEFQDFSELKLPEVLREICNFTDGIIIICGPARSGKSTTIATMINYINTTRRMHIVTIEDPIEFLYEDNKSVIDQREIGIDTESFASALKYVMREDPDLVLIGEMRDKESFQASVNIAETGHLIFATLHASSAMQAVERVLEYFPFEQKDSVRMQLGNNLRAIISQRLLPNKSGDGQVPAVEVLIGNSIVRKLIRDNKLTKLNAAIELGVNEGMQTFNLSLLKLIKSDLVAEEVALSKSPNPDALKLNLQGIFMDDARRILES